MGEPCGGADLRDHVIEHLGEADAALVRSSRRSRCHKKPEAPAQAVRDGWFHTGDLAYRDEDGYFFVVDRCTARRSRG
ncbi:hypothetical protein ACQEVB_01020 [Pseudonocardia sp. CA-107938]|uniref:hypothetical protein n=1 Tax=Pseudonocardia sp. CA-107938 TaxID=3240021 RepID=UPI003D90E0B9